MKRSTEPNSARWIMIGRWRCVVGADVLQPEALRQLEVELHRRHLPGAADGVAGLHRDLGAVEGAAALVHDELEAHLERRRCAAPRWPPPTPRRSRRPCRAAWSTAPGRSRRARSPAARRAREGLRAVGVKFTVGLLDVAEYGGVILGDAPHAGQAREARQAFRCGRPCQSRRSGWGAPVRPLAAPVDEAVDGAVHRLEVVAADPRRTPWVGTCPRRTTRIWPEGAR